MFLQSIVLHPSGWSLLRVEFPHFQMTLWGGDLRNERASCHDALTSLWWSQGYDPSCILYHDGRSHIAQCRVLGRAIPCKSDLRGSWSEWQSGESLLAVPLPELLCTERGRRGALPPFHLLLLERGGDGRVRAANGGGGAGDGHGVLQGVTRRPQFLDGFQGALLPSNVLEVPSNLLHGERIGGGDAFVNRRSRRLHQFHCRHGACHFRLLAGTRWNREDEKSTSYCGWMWMDESKQIRDAIQTEPSEHHLGIPGPGEAVQEDNLPQRNSLIRYGLNEC